MRLGKTSKGPAPSIGAGGADVTAKYGVVKETDAARQKYLEVSGKWTLGLGLISIFSNTHLPPQAKRLLKQKMEQEQRNSRANSLKIQTIYRKIMRINKVDGLRKEIEVSHA